MIKIIHNQPEIQDTPCVLFPCGERGSNVAKLVWFKSSYRITVKYNYKFNLSAQDLSDFS